MGRMKTMLRNKNFYIMVGLDAVLVSTSLFFSYQIRFEFEIPPWALAGLVKMVPWAVVAKVSCLYLFNAYRGMWRYTGLEDVLNVARATAVSSMVIILVILLSVRFINYPRSVFLIDACLTFLMIGGVRVLIRLYYAKRTGTKLVPAVRGLGAERKNVLIIGAGDAGEKTLRELNSNPRLPYRVVGFVDDEPRKEGLAIHDVPVLGNVMSLPDVVNAYGVEEVLIAAPSATGPQMRQIVDACDACGVRYKTLPGMGELIEGRVSVKALRDVNYEDLLGRPQVELDQEGIARNLTKSRIMVTGAGGSIGSELCRQIVRFGPEALILVDASESNLYGIQMDLQHHFGFEGHVAVLGDVGNRRLMEGVFGRYRPKVVFHAAAYKHVPMLERNPWQAIHNNVLGTQVSMEQSIRHGASRFVLVSTDKAVRPTNVMGATKRVCELLSQAYAGQGTAMMAVRFGNVVGSSGSVVPLFRKQIEQGGPVTVTHPEITRYFMTTPEACQLILQAGTLGTGGEIFVLEMGTPVKIAEMARDLIRLSGKEPGIDIDILFTGLRPGEKLYEELITNGEGVIPTAHEKIMMIRPDLPGEGFHKQSSFREGFMKDVEALYRLAEAMDGSGIKAKLGQIVPEYVQAGEESHVLQDEGALHAQTVAE